LYATRPVIDWPSQDVIQIAPMTSNSELENSVRRQPSTRAQAGERSVA
jgi:hypothetical protein